MASWQCQFLINIVQMESNGDRFKVSNQTITSQQPHGNNDIMICETIPKLASTLVFLPPLLSCSGEQSTQWSRYEVLLLDEHDTFGVLDAGQRKYNAKAGFNQFSAKKIYPSQHSYIYERTFVDLNAPIPRKAYNPSPVQLISGLNSCCKADGADRIIQTHLPA